MNTYKLLTSACLVVAALFLSCGGGDDDLGDLTTNPGASGSTSGDNSSTSTPPTVDESLLPFVGYWVSNDNYYHSYRDFLLFDDGTCISPYTVQIGASTGKWSFDEKTQYLSNTATMNTFLLTLHDETTILGVDISDNRTVSFTKDSEKLVREELKCIVVGTWKSAEDTLYIGYTSSDGISGKKVPKPKETISRRSFSPYAIWNPGEGHSGTYNIRYYGEKYNYSTKKWEDEIFDFNEKGTVVVENPYTPSKTKLILTGTIEGTYTKISGY